MAFRRGHPQSAATRAKISAKLKGRHRGSTGSRRARAGKRLSTINDILLSRQELAQKAATARKNAKVASKAARLKRKGQRSTDRKSKASRKIRARKVRARAKGRTA